MSDTSLRHRRRARVVAGGTVVLVLAAGGTAWGLSRSSGGGFRTARAAHGTVLQTLSATGTVSPVSRASETFQVAGTVARVDVKAGQKVRAGQVLAHLDRSDLRAQLRSARATLAAARNKISGDETGQSTPSGRSTPTFQDAEPTVVSTSRPTVGQGAGGPSGGSSVSGLQSAVRNAQQATDQALDIANAALTDANAACAATPTSTPTTPDTGSTPSPDGAPDGGSSSDACTAYSSVLLSDEQDVSRDEQQLASAEAALTKALDAMLAAPEKASSSSGSSTPSRASSASNSGSTASASDIALDQADIDQALATVASDEADLAQATLRATIAGRVAAVTIAHGDQLAASSSTPAVLVVGSRQEQVTIDLSATEIRRVKIGMTAHVVADGSSRDLTGRVVAVNSAGTTSSGTVSYPVTVSLPAGTDVVGGAAAAVTVVVETVDDVLAVPTSAVHYSGATAYVELLRSGKEVRRTVKVGAVGAALTAIASGLTDGQQVILADLGAAVPSSSSTLTRGGGAFFGPGGGGGGAGFTRRFAGGGGATGPVAVGGPAG